MLTLQPKSPHLNPVGLQSIPGLEQLNALVSEAMAIVQEAQQARVDFMALQKSVALQSGDSLAERLDRLDSRLDRLEKAVSRKPSPGQMSLFVGQTKTENEHTYQLNQSHRWERADKNKGSEATQQESSQLGLQPKAGQEPAQLQPKSNQQPAQLQPKQTNQQEPAQTSPAEAGKEGSQLQPKVQPQQPQHQSPEATAHPTLAELANMDVKRIIHDQAMMDWDEEGDEPEFVPTLEAQKLLQVLTEIGDPEDLLEMIIPGNISSVELKSRIKEADKAISVAKQFNVTDFNDLYEASSNLREAISDGDKNAVPPIPGAQELFDALSTAQDTEWAIDFVFEEYSKRDMQETIEEMAEGGDDVSAIKEAMEIALRPEIKKAFGRVERWDPDNLNIGEFESLEDAEYAQQFYGMVTNPILRKIGKLLGSDDADRAWDWLYDKATVAQHPDRSTKSILESYPTYEQQIEQIKRYQSPEDVQKWIQQYPNEEAYHRQLAIIRGVKPSI